MKVQLSALVLLPLALGAAVEKRLGSETCTTRYTSTPVTSVKTTTKSTTSTLTFTRTHTYTPTVTVTRVGNTKTITTSTTATATATASQTTDTSTVTSTETDTTTSTITTTSTETDTTTTTATTTTDGTMTVPTVNGFTPVASVPSVVQNGGGNEVPANKRSLPMEPRSVIANKLAAKCKARYPSSVICNDIVQYHTFTTTTVTATSTSTRTVRAPPRTTVTSTSTDTVTTTVTPADTTVTATDTATSTETDTSTSTASTTTTNTVTTTTTFTNPTATAYAACQSNNMIDAVGGSIITDFNRPNAGFFGGVSGANTAEACCVACQTASGCLGFGFSLSGIDFSCLLIQDTTDACDPTISTWQFFHDAASGQVVVGDGPCGQGTYTS